MGLLIPVAVVGGIVALIYKAVSDEEREASQRWEEMLWDVERSVEEHRRNIEAHLAQAQYSYNFQILVDEHYASMKTADAAYKLLDDARNTENGLNKMLKEAKDQRTLFRERLKEAKKIKDKGFIFFKKTREKKNKTLIRDIELQLKEIRELRESAFDGRDKVKAQKASFLQEVQRLNNRTRELKELIRDQCGIRGLDWFNRLEERTRKRRLSEGKH